MSRPRDMQRQRVYDWQHALASQYGTGYSEQMTIDACGAMATQAHALYGIKWHGFVTGGAGNQRSALAHGTQKISLPEWARNPWVVCHEAAHCIVTKLWPGSASHGPEFVRIMIELWYHLKIMHMPVAMASARAAGVKVKRGIQFRPVTTRREVTTMMPDVARIAAQRMGGQ